jgi:hypothetical protein
MINGMIMSKSLTLRRELEEEIRQLKLEIEALKKKPPGGVAKRSQQYKQNA